MYEQAKRALESVQVKYDELFAATEEFRSVIEDALAAERARSERNVQLVARLERHKAAIADLLDVLVTLAHDHLIRASDRITMIRVAERGEAVKKCGRWCCAGSDSLFAWKTSRCRRSARTRRSCAFACAASV